VVSKNVFVVSKVKNKNSCALNKQFSLL